MPFWSQLWKVIKIVVIIVLAFRVYVITTIAVDYLVVAIGNRLERSTRKLFIKRHESSLNEKVIDVQPLKKAI
jgi:hypothetical protein